MRIVVLIPDAKQLDSAGVRIRYRRIEPHLKTLGHEFELLPIDAFRSPAQLKADVVLFSKCHDARAPLAAEALREAGALTGVDVFDDYFSDATDSRFTHLRDWMRSIAPHLGFALCATPRMREALGGLLPGLPVQMINDPAGAFEPEAVAGAVARKTERARATRTADVGWFGIGDNPYFPVGLSDLAAFGHALRGVRRAGFEPRLSIVTNARALTPAHLEQLARLPVPYRIEEWSAEAERQVLADSLFCVLPVNAQAFSVAKSLNRAVTTLASGCQALAAGFPLYERLAPFIYEDASTLMTDVAAGRPALRAETLPAFVETISRLANPRVEATALADFLTGLARPAPAARRARAAALHGKRSSGEIHKFALRCGALSVASPFIKGDGAYDVRFIVAAGDIPAFALSPAATAALARPLKPRLKAYETRAGKAFSRLDLAHVSPPPPRDILDILEGGSTAAALARYPAAMSYLAAALRTMFGDMAGHVSNLQAPFTTTAASRGRPDA